MFTFGFMVCTKAPTNFPRRLEVMTIGFYDKDYKDTQGQFKALKEDSISSKPSARPLPACERLFLGNYKLLNIIFSLCVLPYLINTDRTDRTENPIGLMCAFQELKIDNTFCQKCTSVTVELPSIFKMFSSLTFDLCRDVIVSILVISSYSLSIWPCILMELISNNTSILLKDFFKDLSLVGRSRKGHFKCRIHRLTGFQSTLKILV